MNGTLYLSYGFVTVISETEGALAERSPLLPVGELIPRPTPNWNEFTVAWFE
jgi:hypothetical protein